MPVSIIEQFRRKITVGIENSYMMLTWIIIVRINFRQKKNGTETNNGGKMSKTVSSQKNCNEKLQTQIQCQENDSRTKKYGMSREVLQTPSEADEVHS